MICGAVSGNDGTGYFGPDVTRVTGDRLGALIPILAQWNRDQRFVNQLDTTYCRVA